MKNIIKNNLHLFVYVFTTQDFAALAEVSFEGVVAVVAVVVDAVAVVAAAAPQTALRVVENHFAIAINGALKILLELGSAPMEDVRSTIFLSWSAVELQLFAKSSKSGCGC